MEQQTRAQRLKKVWKFLRRYRQLTATIVATLIAGILDLAGQDTISHWVLILTAIVNVIPLLIGMVNDLRDGTYGIDILAATAIITAIIMREYWAAIVIVLMLIGGETLEDYAQERAKTELTALLDRAPKKAHLLKGGKVLDVKVSQIMAKNKILIKPGEVVPVDAVILEGTASFDESSLTGESLPVTKDVGDQLLSGSINIDGAIVAQALHTAADSQFEQIVKLVRSASATKSPFVRLADRYSIPFTAIAFAIAIGAWVVSGDSHRFLAVLVVATPCPLIFAAPVALISGMSRAAKNGIIVKTGSALEQLAQIKTMGFDKTGTLTVGKPILTEVKAYGGGDKNLVLAAAAALEQNSTHVLATAVVEGAKKRGLKFSKTKHLKEYSGKGLEGTYAGKLILIGRLSFLEEQGIEIPNKVSAQQTATYVAINSELAGVLLFEDELRPESKPTLNALKRLGIENILMITGDNNSVAQAIAKRLGINQVVSGALPADKLLEIENIKQRPVGFVGDGVNDAPVLTAADVGIALGARGSTAASESADVVIMRDDIKQVAVSVAIAKRTFFIAKQSILVGIWLSIMLMFIFATGKFKPVYGALIQEAVDILVIFNALRAHGPFKNKNDKLLSID